MELKDAFDLVTDVIALVNVPAVTSLITGKVHPNIRPDGSNLSDLVVTSTGVIYDQIQTGYGYVNIYVPKTIVNGKMVTDQIKLKELANVITPLINNQFRNSFSTKIDQPAKLFKDTDGSHFASIKVKYTSIRENYEHI